MVKKYIESNVTRISDSGKKMIFEKYPNAKLYEEFTIIQSDGSKAVILPYKPNRLLFFKIPKIKLPTINKIYTAELEDEKGNIEPIYYIKLFGIYFYSNLKIKKKPYNQFIPSSSPVVYTLEEIKSKYKSRWSIPVSPEIVVLHNNKLYNFQELKKIW